jgi:hypothetical protein
MAASNCSYSVVIWSSCKSRADNGKLTNIYEQGQKMAASNCSRSVVIWSSCKSRADNGKLTNIYEQDQKMAASNCSCSVVIWSSCKSRADNGKLIFTNRTRRWQHTLTTYYSLVMNVNYERVADNGRAGSSSV